jgi:predicted ArsR family transcriptional regulator
MSVAAVEHLLKASRSVIVELLKTRGAMSAEELAAALAVSKVGVRRHLSVLESDGLVCYEVERRERGRPRYVYRLTEKANCLFPRIYDEFAREMLEQIEKEFGADGLQKVLCGRADELIARLRAELDGLTFDRRVKRLAEIVSEKGYLAEARRLRDGSYRLRQRNCPVESVAVSHPQVCCEEMRVYSEALGCEIVRECRIADGAEVCEFRVTPPAKRALRVLPS